jgi:hypothetical protein
MHSSKNVKFNIIVPSIPRSSKWSRSIKSPHQIPVYSGFGGLVVNMLGSGTQDHGFFPGRSRQIFSGEKSSACLPSEGK